MTGKIRFRRQPSRRLAAWGIAVATLLAGTVAAPPAMASGLVVESVILARGADDPLNPSGRTTKFAGVDTVFAVVRLDGLPKTGVVTGVFSFRGEEFARTSSDMADRRNKTQLAGDTFVTFNVSPAPGTKYLIGTSYLLKVLLDGKVDGSIGFSVLPPKGTFPTKALRSQLVAEDGTVRKVFSPKETVKIQVAADLGMDSWVEATWKVSGKIDPDGTQSATVTKPARNGVLAFAHRPIGGWPVGKHSVSLVIDDRPGGEVSFTVR